MNEDLSSVIQQALFNVSPLSEDTDSDTSASGLPDVPATYVCMTDKYSSLTNLNKNFDLYDTTVELSDSTITKECIDDLVFDRCAKSGSNYFDKESFDIRSRETQIDIESCNLEYEEIQFDKESFDNSNREAHTDIEYCNYNKEIQTHCTSIFDEESNDLHDDVASHHIPARSSSPSTLPTSATGHTTSSTDSPTNNTTSDETPSCEPPKVKKTRKRIKNHEPYPDPILPPCIICNEKASGFHYGANTCEACKGFFRRTLKKDKSRLKCKCKLDMREQWKRGPVRNSCSSCRFNRCLKEGMSKDAIKIGRYTVKHRTENIIQIKSAEAIDKMIDVAMVNVLESGPSSTSGLCRNVSENSPSSTTGSSLNMRSLDDIIDLPDAERSVVSTSSQTDFDEMAPVVKKAKHIQNEPITPEEIESIVNQLTEAQINSNIVETRNVPIEIIKQRQTDYLEKYNMKKQMFGDMVLSKEEFQEFYKITGIDLDGRIQHMKGAFNYFERRIFKIVDFAKSIPGFKRLSLNDQANLIKASRVESTMIGNYKARYRNIDLEKRVVTTPWGKHIHLDELAKIHPTDAIISQYELCRLMVGLNLTVEEDAVIRAIVTMFSDRCPLEEPAKVERIQEKLITCLQHLLNVRSNVSGSLFYRIFSFLTNLRNFSENEQKFRELLIRDYPMLSANKYQLVKEFMS